MTIASTPAFLTENYRIGFIRCVCVFQSTSLFCLESIFESSKPTIRKIIKHLIGTCCLSFSDISYVLNIEKRTAAGFRRLAWEVIFEYMIDFGDNSGGFEMTAKYSWNRRNSIV